METINSATAPTPFNFQETGIQRSGQASRTQLAAISNSRSLDLELTTKEGDKVTLSVDARVSAFHAAFGQVQAGDGDDIDAQWGELSAGQYDREVTMTVEGDLNRAERREIRKVMKMIDKMMKKFIAGKLEPMMAKADKLKGLHTIDSLEVDMAYERQVVVAQETRAAISYDRSGEVSTVPAGSDNRSDLDLEAEADSLAGNLARTVISAGAPTDHLREMADELLKAYREQSAEWNPPGGRIMDRIRDLFNARLDAQ